MKKVLFVIVLWSGILLAQDYTIFQAEDGRFISAKVETEHSGYTGAGYVNFDNQTGSGIEFVIPMAEQGAQTLKFRFANGSTANRYMSLWVNDVEVNSQIDFNATGAWSTWDSTTISADLVTGNNYIKLISETSDGGPNLDFIGITGTIGIMKYKLNIEVYGNGSVAVSPNDSLFDAGTQITLTAEADDQSEFANWFGDLSGNENPVNFTIEKDYSISAVFQSANDTINIDPEEIVGFASLGGGTTGGNGGDTVIVNSYSQLEDLILPRTDDSVSPLVVLINGTLTGTVDMLDIKRTANITFYGVGNDAVITGAGFKIVQSSNIIVRNLTFADCTIEEGDGLTVDRSNNVWIDHCSFTDSPSIDLGGKNHDGLLDVKKGSYNVTISYNHLMNHRKTCLFGHSVSETDDVNMKVTYYRNWFDKTFSRNPRTRYGRVHLLNNLYTGVGSDAVWAAEGTGYGVGVTCAAQVMLEGNYFEDTDVPVLISLVNDPGGTLSSNPEGYIKSVDNFTIASGDIIENLSGYDFNPADYYEYTPAAGYDVKQIVVLNAGAGKLDNPNSINEEIINAPDEFTVLRNYPNPFNPSTKIQFSVPSSGLTKLKVYDILGKEIAVLFNETAEINKLYTVAFNASNLSSGIYLYTLQNNNSIKTAKMMFLK